MVDSFQHKSLLNGKTGIHLLTTNQVSVLSNTSVQAQ
jgi:hypothetical protein